MTYSETIVKHSFWACSVVDLAVHLQNGGKKRRKDTERKGIYCAMSRSTLGWGGGFLDVPATPLDWTANSS